MKKLILSLFGVALIATAVYAASTQMKNTGAGLYIGTTVAQKLGFYGATPVVRQTITNTAPVLAALTLYTQTQIITNVFPADTTNVFTVVSVTNVAINAIAGYSGTNQLNQVRTALVNLGLVSTDGN
jgi:Ca2+/H+ antiporter